MKYFYSLAVLILFYSCSNNDGVQKAIIETDLGKIEIMLYNETPLHKENFIKLVKEKYYDGLLFHRVIPGFVIQGGDPESRGAAADKFLGSGGPGYELNAEIGAPHFKGTLAAARNNNPEKKSSGSQFYIVVGSPVSDLELTQWESRKGIKYNPAQKEKYIKQGGLPSLDAEYTVFGEVINGIDIVEKIASAATNPANRPLQDVSMKINLK